MRKFILMGLCVVFLSGCSSKYPSVKTGATIGGVTGIVAGGLLGAGLSKSHPGNGDVVAGAVISGAILGLIGLALGAGTGYLVDNLQDNDDKMQEMIQTEKMMENL